MTYLDGFGLDADITVSELRQEELLDERLHAHHRLRLRRRSEVLGVVVEAEQWRSLALYVRQLEERLERYEDEAVRRLITERAPGARFRQATQETVDAIERQYQELAGSE